MLEIIQFTFKRTQNILKRYKLMYKKITIFLIFENQFETIQFHFKTL